MNKFYKYIKEAGDSVAIVGNGPISENLCKLIDSKKVIIRFNNIDYNNKGFKTNIWVHSFYHDIEERSGSFDFQFCPFPLKNEEVSQRRRGAEIRDLNPASLYFGSDSSYFSLLERDPHPSTGICFLWNLYKNNFPLHEYLIVGFDFFKTQPKTSHKPNIEFNRYIEMISNKFKNKKFYIKQPYSERKVRFFDDTSNKDEYQDEVYRSAKKLAEDLKLNKVLDYGAGSGFKIDKYFSDHQNVELADLGKTCKFLREKYNRKVYDLNMDSLYPEYYDLIIAADVIEHMDNPIILLDYLKNHSKYSIVSTPEKSSLESIYPGATHGPPGNPHHVREWTRKELFKLFDEYGFIIIDHIVYDEKNYLGQYLILKSHEF